jgi:putative hemolysin
MVIKRRDGSLLLDGMLPVSELKAAMGLGDKPLPREDRADFQTLGGFVLAYLGRIPATGDTFGFGRYRFEIMDMDKRRVDKVLLTVRAQKKSASKGKGK